MSLYLLFLGIYIWYLKKYQKKGADKKIKNALFKEIGFTYRETARGKKFLIIDIYKKNKAIKL